MIEQAVPGVFGGSNSRARGYFEKAIETSPDEPLNYLALAKLLEEELDEHQEAMEIARKKG